MKHIVITGGVVSGLGKGVTTSSIAVLLKASGVNVTTIKIDPYLNLDAGTMSPFEHGECYVLDDGGECDLDLGNYERFGAMRLTKDHNITTGKINALMAMKERRGDYLGKTVQSIPHVTDAIQEWIERVAKIPVCASNKVPDVCLIELGGTVGDIESMLYLEAFRQMMFRMGEDNFCVVHVSLVLNINNEPKTKPIQRGVEVMRQVGLHPRLLVCRHKTLLEYPVVEKLSKFTMVAPDHIITSYDATNIYNVPLMFLEQRVPNILLSRLKLNKMPPRDIPQWRSLATSIDTTDRYVTIVVVGKYTGLTDSYLSIIHALTHAGLSQKVRVEIKWVDAELLVSTSTAGAIVKDTKQTDEKDVKNPSEKDIKQPQKREKDTDGWTTIKTAHGILIPGGFGNRGIEGMIATVRWARENKKPLLGICLGMQVAIIEWTRHVLNLKDANSTEFDSKTKNPVVIEMPEIDQVNLGGTMRLGARRTNIKSDTLAFQLYKQEFVMERHRHRFEVNPQHVDHITKSGIVFSGTAEKQHMNDKSQRMEIMELPTSVHPFFFGVQFHPEFLSRPLQPSMPFVGFISAAVSLLK